MAMSERDLRRKKVDMATGRRLPGGKLIPLKSYQELGRETRPLPTEITPTDTSWETEIRSVVNWLDSGRIGPEYQDINRPELVDQFEKNRDFYMNFFEVAKQKYFEHNPIPFNEFTDEKKLKNPKLAVLFGPITKKILSDVDRVEKVRARLS